MNVVVISRWQVADRAAQRAFADTEAARQRRSPWPEGRRSTDYLLGTDGRLVLRYDRWRDEQSYRRYAEALPGQLLDTVVCGFSGQPPQRPADGPYAGCVALVTLFTDGPERQREATARIAAFGAQPDPGALGGHVLCSLDGTRVILYAEWTSEEAHREAVAGPAYGGERGIFDGNPGIRGLAMNRYQLYRRADSTTGA